MVDFEHDESDRRVGASDVQNSPEPHIERTAAEKLRALARWCAGSGPMPAADRLDDRLCILVGFGAALALGRPHGAIRALSDHARDAGATLDQVLGTMLVVAPTIGTASVVSNAPVLADALGYDIEAALEDPGKGPV